SRSALGRSTKCQALWTAHVTSIESSRDDDRATDVVPPTRCTASHFFFPTKQAGSSSSLWQRARSSAPPLLPWPSSSCPWRPMPFSSSLLSTAINREQDQQPWRPENLVAELPRPAIVPPGEQQSRPPPALRPTAASGPIPSSRHGRAQWRSALAIPSAPSSSMDCSNSTLLSMARASFFRAAEAPPHGAPTPCYIFSQPPLTLPGQPAQRPSSPWRPRPSPFFSPARSPLRSSSRVFVCPRHAVSRVPLLPPASRQQAPAMAGSTPPWTPRNSSSEPPSSLFSVSRSALGRSTKCQALWTAHVTSIESSR
ncbi:hypothetical protein ACJX0J_042028, partial [Zea mays]